MLKKSFKNMNFPSSANGLLHNKIVLYVVFAIALFNLLHETVRQDYLYCALFILTGFITSFFSKNMIVILVIAMAFATILRGVVRGTVRAEGFQEGADDEDKGTADNANADKKTADKETAKKDKEPVVNGKVAVDKKDSGCTVATKAAMIDSMKHDAVELMSVQNQIINGFQTIEPAMDRAEALVESIQSTANTIENLKKNQVG
jgi:branched-subunit amino acid transport protein